MRLRNALLLIVIFLCGCAAKQPIALHTDADPDRVFRYGQLQFEDIRQAFVLTEQSIELNDRTWPLLIDLSVEDKQVICFEHRTNDHNEDCTTIGTLRAKVR